jgi:hypothetical protein
MQVLLVRSGVRTTKVEQQAAPRNLESCIFNMSSPFANEYIVPDDTKHDAPDSESGPVSDWSPEEENQVKRK